MFKIRKINNGLQCYVSMIEADIQPQLSRRRPGQSKMTTDACAHLSYFLVHYDLSVSNACFVPMIIYSARKRIKLLSCLERKTVCAWKDLNG